jgi:N-acetylmannosamine-6-phosphate 2-epimerase/N-acetylmannosamine kinase
VASVQASPGSPLGEPETLVRLGLASRLSGAGAYRVEGVPAIGAFADAGLGPIIGLIKREYEGSPVYITPTLAEVGALAAAPCNVVAFDATLRPRPDGSSTADIVEAIHRSGRLALADCDSLESALTAEAAGVDLVSTTLCGYTEGGAPGDAPDLETLREIVERVRVPVLAEGRFTEPWQARAALAIGAAGVVIGGALNDPVKQTRRFAEAVRTPKDVAAFDIGGTWLRWGRFREWSLIDSVRVPTPPDPDARLRWMSERIGDAERVGIGTGGVVDPATNTVLEAKPIIPNHVGTRFEFAGVRTIALNDGLATAWGHSFLPRFAGRRVATLALGTGVGFGLVDRGRLLMGPRGEYPRLNDARLRDVSIEEVLGGAALGGAADEATRAAAGMMAEAALALVRSLMLPDAVVLCGGVGLAPWLTLDAVRSPFGEDAGLYGAAALALWPPG